MARETLCDYGRCLLASLRVPYNARVILFMRHCEWKGTSQKCNKVATVTACTIVWRVKTTLILKQNSTFSGPHKYYQHVFLVNPCLCHFLAVTGHWWPFLSISVWWTMVVTMLSGTGAILSCSESPSQWQVALLNSRTLTYRKSCTVCLYGTCTCVWVCAHMVMRLWFPSVLWSAYRDMDEWTCC